MDRMDIEAENEGRAIRKHCRMRPKIIGRPLKASRKIVNGHVQYRTKVDFKELKKRIKNT